MVLKEHEEDPLYARRDARGYYGYRMNFIKLGRSVKLHTCPH